MPNLVSNLVEVDIYLFAAITTPLRNQMEEEIDSNKIPVIKNNVNIKSAYTHLVDLDIYLDIYM